MTVSELTLRFTIVVAVVTFLAIVEAAILVVDTFTLTDQVRTHTKGFFFSHSPTPGD